MSVYLKDIPLVEAQSRLDAALKAAGLGGLLRSETIPLDDSAVGRVLAGPVFARLSSPHYHASAMDGFAVRSAETTGAMPSRPVELVLGCQAWYVDTGDPLPEEANAVIPIELVESLDAQGGLSPSPRKPHSIRIREALTPWMHVRPMGEDIKATELVLPSGRVLQPADLGAAAASGAETLLAAAKPRVAILPTGTELIPIGAPVEPGRLIEFNSVVLAAQIRQWGGIPERYPITSDDFDEICRRVQQAADTHDLVLVNAGSSAGEEDYTARMVETLETLLVHGVAIRPGHPVILGMLRRSAGIETQREVPVIGVPGYPVSTALTGEIFVKPLLERWLGKTPEQPVEIEAALTRKITSPPGDDDYVRVSVGKVEGRTLAMPLARGAGVITSLVKADGLMVLPRSVQGMNAGDRVRVRLYRPAHELENTLLCIGSHDLTLDLLAQALAREGQRFISSNVGSQGGLAALRRHEAHLAGAHLLDPATGQYNLSAIREYLPDVPVRLVGWVGREQGLLVRKGNPKKITGLHDLVDSSLRYINRQRGSGTRILLDYQLASLGAKAEQVAGYDQEEYTHLGVAAAVASGRADAGLGVAAAAQALELDFIPLYSEQYDLVIPLASFKDHLLDALFRVAENSAFRRSVAELPGYDVSPMGVIRVMDSSQGN